MGLANKKQRLRSSQRLPWSSRMGWQVVSTTIFEWLLNLWLKMWTNYRVITADNLLIIICKITQSAKLLNLQNYISAKLWGLKVIFKERIESMLASRSKFLQLGFKSKLLQLASRSKFLQLRSRSKLLKLGSLDNLSEILWNPSLISRFPSPKIRFSSLKIQFTSTAFQFPRNLRKSSSTAFRFLQRVSSFFNGFLLTNYSYLE